MGDLSTTHLYPKVLQLMELWLDQMIATLQDPESRSASDFANARQFLKDNNIVVEKPSPHVNRQASAEILQDPEGDELPSFMRDRHMGITDEPKAPVD
jgi:hypothetical protein